MLYTATDNTRIDFTIPSDSALRRIIVDPDLKSVGVWLGNKQIEQLATYIKGAKVEQAFATPSNLTTVLQCSSSIETSSIWSDFTFAQVGDSKNQAQVGKLSGFEKVEKLDPLPVSYYMTDTESHMIEQWAGRVVETADPNEIIPDSPVDSEGQRKVGRTRRVKRVEDEEDEEDVDQDPPVVVPLTARRSMNDALNSQFNAERAKVGRTRIKKIDEDEEEDEFGDDQSIGDTQEDITWTYPPVAEPNGRRPPSMPLRKRQGRQRMVKVDSDEEAEDNGFASSVRDEPQSLEWGYSSPIPPSTNLDRDEVSSLWDETVYPGISSFGAINASSEQMQKTVDLLDRKASDKVSALDKRSDRKPVLSAKKWGSVADEKSKSSPGEECQGKGRGRGRGRGSRGQGQGLPRSASNTQNASQHGRDRGRGTDTPTPQASNEQYRWQSNTCVARAYRASTLSGQSSGRGNQSGRAANKFGALATDTLVDFAESDVVNLQTIPSPPGFEPRRQTQLGSIQALPSQADITETTPNADLIDVTTPESAKTTPIAPPPGFESLSSAGGKATTNNQRKCLSVEPRHGGSSASVISQNVSSMPNTGALYVNTSNPGMNLVEMSRRRVDQLHRACGEAESRDTSSEKIQDVDESSTRTYHTTMNQQAKKPAQKKKEVEQKRAEVLQRAWGDGVSSSQARASGSVAAASARQPEGFEMSTAKKKLLRGKESMANSHPEAANEEQTVQQNDRFVAALTPLFTAARAFPGALNFEVQLGQFLSPSPEGPYQPRCVTVNQWHKLYDSAQGRLASAATFTNILTRNGADIDHILKLKIPKGGGSRLFHPDNPGRFGIRFEFHCQGKNNDEFKLVFNSRGEYEIERPFRKIGQVNLHVPGQIWDAAAMLTGSTRFSEEQALKDAAEELSRSIYIPEGRKEIEVSYRLPSSNEFAVKKVVMRRISRHACAIMDKHDVQLQITEVQRLFVERRSDGIYLAYVSKYEKMVDQMMIHFEISLISESVERAMSVNANLAVGDVTTAWTEESLLQKWRTKTLLELTHLVLSKTDGVGFHNVGSAVFFLNQDSVLAGGSAVAIGSHVPNQSMTKAATQNAHAAINVPGVRGGLAQPANHGYALGYGGARIPIPGLGGPEAVNPDDSASQAPERGEGMGQGQVIEGFW